MRSFNSLLHKYLIQLCGSELTVCRIEPLQQVRRWYRGVMTPITLTMQQFPVSGSYFILKKEDCYVIYNNASSFLIILSLILKALSVYLRLSTFSEFFIFKLSYSCFSSSWKITNNIWTLGYCYNRMHSSVLYMYPYTENPRHETFHGISKITNSCRKKWLRDFSRHRTQYNRKGKSPENGEYNISVKVICINCYSSNFTLKHNSHQLFGENGSIYMNLYFVLLKYQNNPTRSIHSITVPQIVFPSGLKKYCNMSSTRFFRSVSFYHRKSN